MRSNKYIVFYNSKVIIISDSLEVCLSVCIDKIIEYKYMHQEIDFKNILIQEYLEGVTLNKNIYFDITKICFVDEYDAIIAISNDLGNKINKYIKSHDNGDTQTQLDIFIPLSINEPKTENVINTEFITKLEKENKDIDLDFIKKRIDELTHIKNKETEKIEEMKNTLTKKKDIILKTKSETENKKSKLKYEKEKWEEIKRKYDINYNIYLSLKNEIKTGERKENDIPELFVNEYNIFEKIFIPDVDKKELFDSYLDEKKQNKNTDLFTKYNNLFEEDNIIISDNSSQHSEPETSDDYDSDE